MISLFRSIAEQWRLAGADPLSRVTPAREDLRPCRWEGAASSPEEASAGKGCALSARQRYIVETNG